MARGFEGLRVVAFESRHAEAMRNLISNYGGVPILAPSLREVPLEENPHAAEFARKLIGGEIDVVIFLTGVGTRMLARMLDAEFPRERWVTALSEKIVVARGPKPVAALKELGMPISVTVPEPNTWRELLESLDERAIPLEGRRVAVQEYGSQNKELLEGLRSRGAEVIRVPVYKWALPLDTAPLRHAIEEIIAGRVEVALFTTSVQVAHVLAVAAEMGFEEELRQAFSRMVIASIGPICSLALEEYSLVPDLESTTPKMGILVREAAEHSRELLLKKRQKRGAGDDLPPPHL
jgi:uroporphyrinogen-III synthase